MEAAFQADAAPNRFVVIGEIVKAIGLKVIVVDGLNETITAPRAAAVVNVETTAHHASTRIR